MLGGGAEWRASGGGPVGSVWRAKKNSLEAEASRLFSRTEILVRLAGFEPTTPWFVVAMTGRDALQINHLQVA